MNRTLSSSSSRPTSAQRYAAADRSRLRLMLWFFWIPHSESVIRLLEPSIRTDIDISLLRTNFLGRAHLASIIKLSLGFRQCQHLLHKVSTNNNNNTHMYTYQHTYQRNWMCYRSVHTCQDVTAQLSQLYDRLHDYSSTFTSSLSFRTCHKRIIDMVIARRRIAWYDV